MRLLIDESLPRRLGRELRGHRVVTVPEMGWAGKTNGELLSLARGEFDAFLTADQNLQYQQSLSESDIPIVVLGAQTNRFDDLKSLIPDVLSALEKIRPGEVISVVTSEN